MRSRAQRSGGVAAAVAALVVAVILACAVAAIALAGPAAPDQPVVAGLAESFLGVPFGLVGALVLARRPGNRVGWVFCAVGLTWAVVSFASAYGAYALGVPGGPLPAGMALAWVSQALGYLPSALLFFYVPLLYPDGRLESGRRRAGAVLGLALILLSVIALGLQPGPLTPDDVPLAPNPLGIAGAAGLLHILEEAAALLFVPLIVAAHVSLVLRYRRARGIVRQQLKWFLAVYAALLAFLVMLPVGHALGVAPTPWTVEVPLLLLILGVPASLGLAVLRHGLYEIDRIVSRTVSYALLSAMLAGVYLGAVFVLQGLARPVMGESQLATAGATLTVAALFGPARRRVQAAVDRRFNRARYDAQRTVEAFRARLRDEVDLHQLDAALVGAIRTTVEPAHVSLWLRSGADR